ncbi:MAG: hypothetical protein ABSA84_08095 [Gammaproteobacteria bacterium]
MTTMNSILLVIISIVLAWVLYSNIKNKPELFTAKNLNKSFFTTGILAIILILIIGMAVIMLKK